MKNNKTLSELKASEKNARRDDYHRRGGDGICNEAFQPREHAGYCPACGISPALIYRHFPDQQSLFAETYVRGIMEFWTGYAKGFDTSRDGAFGEVVDDFIVFLFRATTSITGR